MKTTQQSGEPRTLSDADASTLKIRRTIRSMVIVALIIGAGYLFFILKTMERPLPITDTHMKTDPNTQPAFDDKSALIAAIVRLQEVVNMKDYDRVMELVYTPLSPEDKSILEAQMAEISQSNKEQELALFAFLVSGLNPEDLSGTDATWTINIDTARMEYLSTKYGFSEDTTIGFLKKNGEWYIDFRMPVGE